VKLGHQLYTATETLVRESVDRSTHGLKSTSMTIRIYSVSILPSLHSPSFPSLPPLVPSSPLIPRERSLENWILKGLTTSEQSEHFWRIVTFSAHRFFLLLRLINTVTYLLTYLILTELTTKRSTKFINHIYHASAY